MDTRTKIAIAMRKAHGEHICTQGYAPLKPWDDIPPERHKKWLLQADAAIDVMMTELAEEQAKTHGARVRQEIIVAGEDPLGWRQSKEYLNRRYSEIRKDGDKSHSEAILMLYYEGAEEEAIAEHIRPANLTAKKG